MNETENFKGNSIIRDAITKERADHNEENWKQVISAILERTHEDSSFLVPVDFRRQKGKTDMLFRLVDTKDGKKFLPVFTDEEEVKRKNPTGCAALPIRAVLDQALHMTNIEGILLNPWGESFAITNRNVKALLDSDNMLYMQRRGIFFDIGDITRLRCGCIVNSADPLFDDGGGEDHAIYEKGGEKLMDALDKLGSIRLSEAKITPGYDLPQRYIIHTVGPAVSPEDDRKADTQALSACYTNCLDLAKKHDIHSIAFPAISTGKSGFPGKPAAETALLAVTKWLDENQDYGISIIFSCINEESYQNYKGFIDIVEQHKKAEAAKKAAGDKSDAEKPDGE